MAATTLEEVRRELYDRLDDPHARRWPPTMLTTWINEGCRDIARRAECLQSVTNMVVAPNQQTIPMADLTNLLRIHRVEWQGAGRTDRFSLEIRDVHSMDALWQGAQTQSKGDPFACTLKGTPPALNLMLYPTPPSGGQVTVWWWRFPATLNADADTIDLPDGWYDLAIDYAEHRAMRRDRNPAWKEAFEIYKDNLNSLVEQTRRYTDQNAAVITPELAGLPNWIYDEGWYG